MAEERCHWGIIRPSLPPGSLLAGIALCRGACKCHAQRSIFPVTFDRIAIGHP